MTAVAPTVSSGHKVETKPARKASTNAWARRAPVFTIVVTQIPFILTVVYSFQSWNLVRPGSNYFVAPARTRLALLLDRKFPSRGVVRTLLITPFLILPAAGALLWKTTMFDGGPGTASTHLPYDIYQRACQGFDIGQSSATGVIVVTLTLVVATWVVAILFVFPLLWMVLTAVKQEADAYTDPPRIAFTRTLDQRAVARPGAHDQQR